MKTFKLNNNMKKEIVNWLNNHRLFKNFIGGMILAISILIMEESNLLHPFLEGIYSAPAWFILFNWNY